MAADNVCDMEVIWSFTGSTFPVHVALALGGARTVTYGNKLVPICGF